MKIFFKCIYEALIYRIFVLAYPISLFFLYKENKLLNFYTTISIVFLSIIYFICYYVVKLKESQEKDLPANSFFIKQILYLLLDI